MAPTRRDFLVRSVGIVAAAVLPVSTAAAAIHPEPVTTVDTHSIDHDAASVMTGLEWAQQYRDAVLQLRPDAVVEIESTFPREALVSTDQHDMTVHFISGGPSGGTSILMVARDPMKTLGLQVAAFGLASACFGGKA